LAMVVSMPQSQGGTLRKCDWGIITGLALASGRNSCSRQPTKLKQPWCLSVSTAVNHSLVGIKTFQLPYCLATTQHQRPTHWHCQLTRCSPKKYHNRHRMFTSGKRRFSTLRSPSSYHMKEACSDFLLAECE
jgi:hypothetical protein